MGSGGHTAEPRRLHLVPDGRLYGVHAAARLRMAGAPPPPPPPPLKTHRQQLHTTSYFGLPQAVFRETEHFPKLTKWYTNLDTNDPIFTGEKPPCSLSRCHRGCCCPCCLCPHMLAAVPPHPRARLLSSVAVGGSIEQRQSPAAGVRTEIRDFWVRDPTALTIIRHDGPNHLVL